VILKEMDDGAVLYCSETEVYFGLNEVGVCIWNALPPASGNMEELVDTVARSFPDAPADTIRKDTSDFLQELEENGLVGPSDNAPQAG